ncbi:MAG: hypothetical protein ABIG44_10765 [Planctomycetota bacterium]
MKRRTFWSVALMVPVLLAVAAWLVFGPRVRQYYWKRQFDAAWANTDRLVVDPNVQLVSSATRFGIPPLPTYEVRGEEKIRACLGLIEFQVKQEVCACRGDMLLNLYRGERARATISYHHGKYLNWHGSGWPGHAELTPTSAAALENWLHENGCPTSDEAYAMGRKAVDEAMERHRSPTTQDQPEPPGLESP